MIDNPDLEVSLPASFVPTVGYYLPTKTDGSDGRINLWDADGNIYAYNPNNKKWNDITEYNNGSERMLPVGFKAVTGFPYLRTLESTSFRQTQIWSDIGEIYAFLLSDSHGNSWENQTGHYRSMAERGYKLPEGFNPTI